MWIPLQFIDFQLKDKSLLDYNNLFSPQQTFVLMKTSWRRLQDVFIKTNLFALASLLQKTSWSRPIYSSWPYVFKTSCRNVFKTFSRRVQDVLKTSSKHLQDVLQRYLRDVFKMYHQVKLLLLTRLWEAFNTFLRRFLPKTVICRGMCLSNTTSDKFMVSVPNLQER